MPLWTSNFSLSVESDHGTIWEAINTSSLSNPVTAHLYSQRCIILFLYAPCPTRDVTNPFLSVVLGGIKEIPIEVV